jgi:hypothetical protein
VESISCVQNDRMNLFMAKEGWLEENKPAIYWSMLQTAETVASRYRIPREAQDRRRLRIRRRKSRGTGVKPGQSSEACRGPQKAEDSRAHRMPSCG